MAAYHPALLSTVKQSLKLTVLTQSLSSWLPTLRSAVRPLKMHNPTVLICTLLARQQKISSAGRGAKSGRAPRNAPCMGGKSVRAAVPRLKIWRAPTGPQNGKYFCRGPVLVLVRVRVRKNSTDLLQKNPPEAPPRRPSSRHLRRRRRHCAP